MAQRRRIAIFGATSDIAMAAARLWAGEGAELYLVARRSDALLVMARELELEGASRVETFIADLAAVEAQAAVLDDMAERFGVPEVALLAWGSLTRQENAFVDPAYLRDELVVNFVSPAAFLLPLGRRMEEAGGGVVAVISSVAGDRGRARNFVYGSAKAGLQRFLEGLRAQGAGGGLTILDIRPGLIETKMTADRERRGPLPAARPETVGRDIVRAVSRRRAVVYSPWPWRWIMLAIRLLPRPLFHRVRA